MPKQLTLVLLMISTSVCFAQQPADVFAWHHDSLPTQHIYVQFDKQAYVAGDTAWFKAYLYSNYTPSALSTNFFIDLVDENGTVLDAKKLPVLDGVASGNFDLPFNLKQGVYIIRAYTNWLSNLDASFVFKKTFPVFNSALSSTQPKLSSAYRFEIFPEGQKLITSLPNNIAFRATDEQLQVAAVRADLFDSKGRKIGNLTNGKEGQGIFNFTPAAKEKYTIAVTFPDQSSKVFELPAAQETGVILTVADEDQGKSFSAITSPGFIKENETVELVAEMDNQVVLDTKVPFKNNEALGSIATNSLHPGILQAMLLSKDNKLLASRAAVIQNNKLTEKVELRRDSFSIAAKGKNIFTFDFASAITGNFSIAITDADKELANTNHDIFSSLLIESGAKEFIADPKTNDERSGDLVTIPNHWYGSDWPAMQIKKRIDTTKEGFLVVNGKVVDEKTLSPVSGYGLKLVFQPRNSEQKEFQVGLSSNGIFHLDSLVFEDSARIYYQIVGVIKNNKPLPIKLSIEQPKDHQPEFLKNIDYSFSKYAKSIFTDKSLTQIASGIQSKLILAQTRMASKIKPEVQIAKKSDSKQYSSGLFQSIRGRTFDLVKDPPLRGSENVFDYLNGKIPGLQIYRGAEGYQLWSNRSPSFNGNKQGQGIVTMQVPTQAGTRSLPTGLDMTQKKDLIPAIVYVDEIETTPNSAATISIQEIALVKYFEPGSVMLPGVGNSAVFAVWRKTENSNKGTHTDEMKYVAVAGYSPARPFYSPDYSSQTTMAKDNRTTLYWNPEITIMNEKEFTISFYNSDSAKRFRVVMEGFTSEGRLVHFEKVIE